jgi:hypothetical protein
MKENIQYYINSFLNRVTVGNRLDKTNMVVPIKAGGRIFGKISKQFASRHPDFEIPKLEFREAKMVRLNETQTVTFAGYREHESEYTKNHLMVCTSVVLDRAR